jgi:dimethylargininase
LVGGRGLYPRAFPRTAATIAARGIELVQLELSEIAKAEGAVTCCSLLVD